MTDATTEAMTETETDQNASETTVESTEEQRGSYGWLRSTWIIGRRQWAQLLVALVVVVLVYSLVGLALSDWLAPNALTDLDEEVAQSLADGRTDRNDDLAHWGAFLADTPVKIGASILLATAMLWRWRRWHEALFVGMTLIFEACAYITSSFIVGRPRPDVERLLDSPVDTSFPSGHVAAATVYGALVVIVFWHTRNRWLRTLAVVTATAIPLIVGWARLYQGMHFLSDVVAGIVLGLISILICFKTLGAPQDTDVPTVA